MSPTQPPLKIGIVGAGPAGLALALLAAKRLPQADITLFDARPADKDVSGDPRALAISLGSVQMLQPWALGRLTAPNPSPKYGCRKRHRPCNGMACRPN